MKAYVILLNWVLAGLMLVLTACATTPPAAAPMAQPPIKQGTRSCTVQEVQKGGMYVYIRCREKEKDIWLATVARDFNKDEVVLFVDAPPVNNFYSKFLDRVFPEVILTDLLPPGTSK